MSCNKNKKLEVIHLNINTNFILINFFLFSKNDVYLLTCFKNKNVNFNSTRKHKYSKDKQRQLNLDLFKLKHNSISRLSKKNSKISYLKSKKY